MVRVSGRYMGLSHRHIIYDYYRPMVYLYESQRVQFFTEVQQSIPTVEEVI